MEGKFGPAPRDLAPVAIMDFCGKLISIKTSCLDQMNRVTDKIYVADIQQAGRHRAYREHRIDAIIQLTRRTPEQGYPQEVEVYQYQMRDGRENDIEQVEAAVSRALSLLESGNTILVHCSAGTSRSAAVAAASIAISRELTFEQAVEQLRQTRQIHIHPKVLQNAKKVSETLE